MTIIAWDGMTLAADRQATIGNTKRSTTKIRRVREFIIGGSGNYAGVLCAFDWFDRGAKPDDWPASQLTDSMNGYLVVIGPLGVYRYEMLPFPIPILEKFYATGSGADFASGAMAMGATSVQAVEIACRMADGCGMGIDTLRLELK